MGCCQKSYTEDPVFKRSESVNKRKGALQSTYDIIEVLGRGTYGTVSKISHKKTKIIRAMKEVKKAEINEKLIPQLYNEINLLISLDHPNIMKVYEIIESPKSFYIICECLNGGDLFEALKKKRTFTEEFACRCMFDVFSALTYIHEMKIVHCELRLENLIFESSEPNSKVKLADFGLSKKVEEDMLTNKNSESKKFNHLAPEVFEGKYDEKVDIWSAGVALYFMLSGHPLFKTESLDEYRELVKNPAINFDKGKWPKVSSECKDLIKKLIRTDPVKRITAARALKHPWFKKQAENTISSIQTSYCENIKNFKVSSKVVTSILAYISTQMLTSQEESPIAQIFRALDTDGNGKLSKAELLEASKALKLFTAEEVDDIFENCDMDKSGFIDYSEFLTASVNWNQAFKKEKAQMVFDFFDTEKCGNLSLEEFKACFKNISKAEWSEFLGGVDTNSDGNISLQEFKEYIVSFINNQ